MIKSLRASATSSDAITNITIDSLEIDFKGIPPLDVRELIDGLAGELIQQLAKQLGPDSITGNEDDNNSNNSYHPNHAIKIGKIDLGALRTGGADLSSLDLRKLIVSEISKSLASTYGMIKEKRRFDFPSSSSHSSAVDHNNSHQHTKDSIEHKIKNKNNNSENNPNYIGNGGN